MSTYRFECGCQFPIIGHPPSPGALPLLEVDDNNLPLCPKTFEMLSRGDTKGVFQLESQLGRAWTKRLKPENLEHIGALGALLRPGSLMAFDENGISMTEKYCRRKNGEEPVESIHDKVDDVLGSTYGVFCFQEQAIALSREVAGFSLVEADMLRRAIGKKSAEGMAKCKTMFMDGVRNTCIIDEALGERLFNAIEKSQRYSFNRSHAMSYGLTGYDTAYLKSHFPVAFFANWLYYAPEKSDPKLEVAELVADAKLHDVEVCVPDVRTLEPRVSTDGVRVRFGLTDLRGVGDAQVKKLTERVRAQEEELGRPIGEWSWEDFLFRASGAVSSAAMTAFIRSGAMSWTKKTRNRLIAEYSAFSELSPGESKWAVENRLPGEGLEQLLGRLARPKKDGGGVARADRIAVVLSYLKLLQVPPSAEWDPPNEIAQAEEHFLGVALTCARVDSRDLSMVNCSLKDFLAGRAGPLSLGVEVKAVRVIKTKTGKNPGQLMAFLTLSDASASISDAVCFPEAWATAKDVLREDNMAMVEGYRDPKKGSLVVERAFQL